MSTGERYECERCDGGVLTRDDDEDHFMCGKCSAIVAPETLKKHGTKI